MHYILQPGFKSTNGQIEILDSDSLCYIVKNNSKGATGVRTISRSLLNEYVDYFEKYPSNTAAQAREDLAGRTNIDKFEYGYTSTLTTMAKMVTGELLCSSDKAIAAASFNPIKLIDEPLQIIYYGAPGTGKSFTIDNKTDDGNSVRTTFHPDSDYASFVGAYKPTMENVPINSINGESVQFATGKNGHPGTEKRSEEHTSELQSQR